MWPYAAQPVRFDDPAEAALSFAVEYLGFVDPVVGAFQPGDAGSGEVSVQPLVDGPVTTVMVRRLAPDDSWWVVGASTPALELTSPVALAAITSPAPISGRGTAFEGTVDVLVRQDGTAEPLARTFVTAGSMGVIAPFEALVTFDVPTASAGAVVLATYSAEDGTLWEATVVRVAFAPAAPGTTTPPGAVAVAPTLTG